MNNEIILSRNQKVKLGILINAFREYKYETFKGNQNNPFIIQNLCENICHKNTYYKLKCDLIKKDIIYHSLLEKLDLEFSISDLTYNENTEKLNKIVFNHLLHAIEYKDNDALNHVKDLINKIYLNNDCINNTNKNLIEAFIDFKLIDFIDENYVKLIINLLDYFDDIYRCLANHFVALFYLKNKEYELAKNYFLKAKNLYVNNNISLEIINDDIITVYEENNNMFEAVQLSLDMEKVYYFTQNFNRLINVYIFLANYYLMINAIEQAEYYYDSSIKIVSNNIKINSNIYKLYYYWAFWHHKRNNIDKALHYADLAYQNCTDNYKKLEIINLLLILYTKTSQNELNNLIQIGKKYLEVSNESDQVLFRYFVYKYENKDYYGKFTTEKVIPTLKRDREKKAILIFIFEDFYKIL